MNRLDIFCFVSVARTLSFSLTARELMISQQAVSRHIRNLEEEVGYPLFLRNYQNVVLTKAGEKMLEYFSERDRLLEDFYKKSKRLLRDDTLKVAWLQWLSCPSWFKGLIKRFQTENPDVKMLCYSLDACELAEAQVSEELDFILTTRYAARYLPICWKHKVMEEQPLVIVGNSESTKGTEHRIWVADTGEFNNEIVKTRTIQMCKKLGIPFGDITVLPDMGSVCLNILASGGVTFGIKFPVLEANSDFLLTPTNQTATSVLCSPFRNPKPSAERFEQFINREWRDMHDQNTN